MSEGRGRCVDPVAVSIKRGAEWGSEGAEPPDITITGSDADLAARIADLGDAVVRFAPDTASDLAAAVGVRATIAGTVLSLDALVLADGRNAVNAVVIGTAPDRLTRWSRRHAMTITVDGRTMASGRATTVIVAVGQFLRGNDISPRGHPGDGRIEVQRYDVRPGQRRAVRRRLRQGEHLPHPGIRIVAGREVEITLARPLPIEIDGRPAGQSRQLHLTVKPSAYRLLV